MAGFLAMVATLFVCIWISYSSAKGSPKAPSGKVDKSGEEVTQASVDHRRAA
ncbi:MAG: hypothetical protein ABI980_08985 [Nitrospirota bacterium]